MRSLLVAGFRIAILALACGSVLADDFAAQKKKLQAELPDLVISSVSASDIPGLLQVTVGADVYYASADGRYFLQAEIFDLDTRANITEQGRENARVGYLDEIADQSAIEFPAKNQKYMVTVFTDIDCGYCRKLHQQIAQYNDLGISIRYLFFPRSGPDTSSWAKAESVWCSDSRQAALTEAKSGAQLPAANCGQTPVASHFELVNELGLRGTPALFTQGGQLLVGYRTPQDLFETLEAE